MEDKNARRIGRNQVKHIGADGELLHDYTGTQYLINNDYVEKQLDQRSNSPEKEIELVAAKQLISNGFEQLTNKQQYVILRIMKGKTLREIGKEMGISHTVVDEHLQAARKKLAGLINKTKDVLMEEQDGK